MFDKILIANRGEIACRVIKTARKMGIGTVAVYSEADARALHVRMADEAVAIGAAPAMDSYLCIEKIIEACRQTGAQGVHPGYGFLSERAEFAHALETAGVSFIGPGAHAISVMGDKIKSKQFAKDAGVNIVPGEAGEITSLDQAQLIADKIGYPVMIKASAGGGGKGMRIAWSVDELEEGFTLARGEAAAAFGDDRIFVEKFITQPRHIEIQVLADKFGNCIHLGERECSIQRRNQKVIEEAPSSFLDEETRQAMGAQAVALAKAVDYSSAGTVEFIVDQQRNFYFLEMNTRLQVEHPVTELITGVDLVEQMIRIAAGERLSMSQDDIGLDGWAVESRIYAEDPFRGFLPSTGRIHTYMPPQHTGVEDTIVRNDTGVFEGVDISVHYDPMIAKLCTHGQTRDKAIDAMSEALDSFSVKGVQHNIDFLSGLMVHERWQAGAISTSFIDEVFADGVAPLSAGKSLRLELAAIALSRHLGLTQSRQQDWVVKLDQDYIPVRVVHTEGSVMELEFATDEKIVIQVEGELSSHLWRGQIDGREVNARLMPILNGVQVSRRGAIASAIVMRPRVAELDRLMPVKTDQASGKVVRSPMPGVVISVHVEPGQSVEPSDTLVIVEAMKMQNILKAEQGGTIQSIAVQAGDSVAYDELLLEFE